MGKKFIGDMIREEMKVQGRKNCWLAQELPCDPSNVTRLFKKKSIDTDLLFRISILLRRNFFVHLSERVEEEIQLRDSQ